MRCRRTVLLASVAAHTFLAVPFGPLCPASGAEAPLTPSAREEKARKEAADAGAKRKQKSFFGLDLGSAPRSKDPAELPLLFEEGSDRPGGYGLRKEVVVARHPKEWRAGAIYFVPSKKCFYLVAEPGHPGTGSRYFYGPFPGEPWKRFGMAEPRPSGKKYSFAIYLVADPIDAGNPKGLPPLDQLHLAADPIVTGDDLISYAWPTHTLHVKEGTRERLPAPSVWGVPFVVVADGQRCYLGSFWTGFSSYVSRIPTISTDPWAVRDGPKNTIRVERAFPFAPVGRGDDPRADERIRKALEALGKLEP